MGNNRKFKFSEMIPNAWFYKLKEMGNRSHQQQTHRKKTPPAPPQQPPLKEHQPHQESLSHTRKSYYFTRDLNPKSTDLFLLPTIDPPRKSSKKIRPTIKKRLAFTPTPTSTTKSSFSSSSSSTGAGEDACTVIDIDTMSFDRKMEDSVSTVQLPPIRTERKKFSDSVKKIGGTDDEVFDIPIKQKKSVRNESLPAKVVTEEEESLDSSVLKQQGIHPHRRFPTASPRFRIRVNSPRIARRAQVNASKGNYSKKSMSLDSLAVMKSSCDPRRDFRDSMMEMIVENNIKASKDLEELLACYLSLNSDEYHNVIIQVFKQIWFDLNKIGG